MPDSPALFEPDGDRFVPTERARGPWDPDALHGGPVGALLARSLEAHDTGMRGRTVRLTLDLLRPVPVAPLAVSARTLRAGRKVQWLEAMLSAGGSEVAVARCLRVRSAPVPLPEVGAPEAGAPPLPATPAQRGPAGAGEWEAFHNRGVEMRYSAGSFEEPGPATVWIRLEQPVVAGEEPTPLMRVVAAADFGNGVGAVLPFTRYLFLNPDLTVSLVREPGGEWVCLEATTRLAADGIGLAECRLYDEHGVIGRSQQALLVEAR